ncbi:MAG: hypothetical protein AAF937_00155 [Planctomycetota bacterium]
MGKIERLTTGLEHMWDTRRARIARAIVLIATLLGGIVLIEIKRVADPAFLPDGLPTVHLAAVSWAIYALLIFEFVEMAFAMSNSVASSVARHLQLYSLVLLRDAFLKLGEFPEPITVAFDDLHKVAIMTSDAAGAVVLFLAATVFALLQRHVPITTHRQSLESFKTFKQSIVITLLVTLAGLVAYWPISLVFDVPSLDIIDAYFTILVFVDVLLAFASLAIADHPAIVFRNFGFAFAAILLRLSLASPEFIRPCLGIAGAAIALSVTLVYNLDLKSGRDVDSAVADDDADAGGPSPS